jgi:ABC-type dipeptide/oligopeptide/nickel transport system ATPase component
MVFQDPFTSLNPRLILGAQIKESLVLHSGAPWVGRADALLRDVGLSGDFLARYPHQLSGGQRQRFAIARALSANPSLLIADEPVSSLDLSVQAQIINLLNTLRREKRLTQIVIAHDLAVIANTCEHVLVMKEGAVVESGPVETVLNAPAHPYTKQLLLAAPAI